MKERKNMNEKEKMIKILKKKDTFIVITDDCMCAVGEKNKLLTMITMGLKKLYDKGDVTKEDIEMVCKASTSSKEEIINISKEIVDKIFELLKENK